MFDVLAWGVFLSLLAMVLAFLAEGRGVYVMRLILGMTKQEGGIDLYETLPHEQESDWQLLAKLDEADGCGLWLADGRESRPCRVRREHVEACDEAHLPRARTHQWPLVFAYAP